MKTRIEMINKINGKIAESNKRIFGLVNQIEGGDYLDFYEIKCDLDEEQEVLHELERQLEMI